MPRFTISCTRLSPQEVSFTLNATSPEEAQARAEAILAEDFQNPFLIWQEADIYATVYQTGTINGQPFEPSPISHGGAAHPQDIAQVQAQQEAAAAALRLHCLPPASDLVH